MEAHIYRITRKRSRVSNTSFHRTVGRQVSLTNIILNMLEEEKNLIFHRYGRRPILIYSVLLVGLFGLAKSFATNYLSFAILHFLGSLFGAGTFAVSTEFSDDFLQLIENV